MGYLIPCSLACFHNVPVINAKNIGDLRCQLEHLLQLKSQVNGRQDVFPCRRWAGGRVALAAALDQNLPVSLV